MAKKSDTWMPFYVTDYLGDTMHLSTHQHGGYLLLLLACWKAGGDLPDDDEQLASITRMTPADWRKSSAVLRRFFVADAGVLSHGRVKLELEKAKALSEKRSQVGKAGGRPPKEKQTETNRFPDAEAKAKQTETPSPSHSSSLRSEEFLAPTVLVGSPPDGVDSDHGEREHKFPNRPPCPTAQIVDLYHQRLPTLPRVDVLSADRKRSVSARWREVLADPEISGASDPKTAAVQFFDWYFDRAAKSKFLTGRVKDWRADFDFLMTPKKFVKVIEGHYQKDSP